MLRILRSVRWDAFVQEQLTIALAICMHINKYFEISGVFKILYLIKKYHQSMTSVQSVQKMKKIRYFVETKIMKAE